MKLTRGASLLLIPALCTFLLLLVLPMATVLNESFRLFIPGRIGSTANAPLTLQNYTELADPAYVGFFLQTFWLGLIASIIAQLIAFPLAYYVARQPSEAIRRLAIAGLVALMFLSALVRVYSLELTFGSTGLVRPVVAWFGLNTNSSFYVKILVLIGLLHYAVPMSALVLIGTIQNVNPRLAEAAQSLGASRLKSHLSVTIPLSINGILSAFLVSYTLSISAFVIPWILGKGRILFVSNLIYSRFSEVANYPSGAAISIVMLILSLLVVYIISCMASPRWEEK